MAAIDQERNIAFAMFRSLVADMVAYEMSMFALAGFGCAHVEIS